MKNRVFQDDYLTVDIPEGGGLYWFCLKVQGSARRDCRLRGSFGLPEANQNGAGTAGHYKPENSSQISVLCFEEKSLMIFSQTRESRGFEKFGKLSAILQIKRMR